MRSAFVVLATALAIVSCREKLPDAGGPYGDRVAADIPKIERTVGLKFKVPPKVELRTRDQVRDFLVSRLKEPKMQSDINGQSATYKVLGLIPDSLDLGQYLVRLLEEQVIGYYNPTTKVLYVVQGAPDDYVGITVMHELIHALQDQYVNLDSIEHVTGNDDAEAAAQAVIEGQAQYEQIAIMAGLSNIAVSMPSGIDQIKSEIRANMSTQPVFSAAPMVLQESMLFPYIDGADFVRRFQAKFPGRSPFDNLPLSTEQILHDSAYFGSKPDRPITVVLPKTPDVIYENTMGEFGTRLFVYKHLNSVIDAANAASGWGGDRYVTVSNASGKSIAWVSVWDTAVDAAEFVTALDQVTDKRYGVQGTKNASGRTYNGRTRTVVVTTRDIGGKTAVMYVDVPAGASTAVLDLARVTLR